MVKSKYISPSGLGQESTLTEDFEKRSIRLWAVNFVGGITCFILLLIPTLAIAQSSQVNSHSTTINLPPNTVAVYAISNNNIDLSIRVLKDGAIVSAQNGPQKLMALEFVVLQTKDKPQSFGIEVSATHLAGFTPKWQMAEVKVGDDNELVAFYQAMYQASQWWNSKQTQAKLDALALVEHQLKRVKQGTEPYWQALIIYTSMLARFNRYAESFALLDKALQQPNNIAWQYAYSLYWHRVDAKQMLDEREATVALYQPLVAMADWQSEVEGVLLRQTQVLGDFGIAQMLWGWSGNDKALIEKGKADVALALSRAAELGDYLMLSNLHNHMWTYWAINKNLDEGEKSLLLALSFAERSQQQNATVWILIHLAKKYQMAGQVVESLQTFRQALALINQTERKQSKANILFGIAEGYRQLGEQRLAKRFYQRALDSYQALKVARGEAKSHFALGRIALEEKAYGQAIAHHQASLAYYQTDSPQDVAKGLLALAQDNLYAGDKQKAKSLADEALAQKVDVRLGSDKLDGLLVLAEVAWHNGAMTEFQGYIAAIEADFARQLQPKQQLKLAALITAELSRKMDIKNLQRHLAQVSEQVLAISQLLDNHENGLAWRDSIDDVLNQFVVALMGFADKLPDAAQRVALHSQVFDLLERFGAINLRQRRLNLASEAFQAKQSPALNALWQRTIAAQQQLVDAQTDDERVKARLALDVAREAYLLYRPVKVEVDTSAPLKAMSIAQLQQALAHDEMLLRYYLRDDIGVAFVITNARWYVLPLPNKQELAVQMTAMLHNIKSQQPLSAKQNALFKQLLPTALLRENTVKKLLVVQDDILGALPLAAIDTAQQSQRYLPLVTRVDVTRIYSASDYFGVVAKTDAQTDNDIAIFADPAFGPERSPRQEILLANNNPQFRSWQQGLARLRWTAAEAQAIKTTFSDKKVTVVQGDMATSEALMSPQMRSAAILHIASHGYFNPEVPEVVGIATAVSAQRDSHEAGFLSLTELLQQRFSSTLVVISGCETLLGEKISGEGFNSLTRGVLSQGAGSVISTLWSIADKPTAAFMKAFYVNLKRLNGHTAKALNLTQRQFARQGRYRSPLYWAGFVLTSSHRQFDQAIVP